MYKKILVPVDGSSTSNHGLSEAIKIAKVHGSVIRLVTIVDEFVFGYEGMTSTQDVVESMRAAGQIVLEEAQVRARQAGVDTSTAMVDIVAGRASTVIVQEAKDWHADVIVMGTHGRRGLARLTLGSDAEEVVRTAGIPVLLVRGPEVECGVGEPLKPRSAAA